MKRLGVTQDRVAEEAGVTRTFVCHVLAGRFKSRKVLTTALRLVAERTLAGIQAEAAIHA